METWKTVKEELLTNPAVREEYERLAFRYQIISLLIDARNHEGLTQAQLAEKIGTKQAAVARFESGNYNPSLDFLEKVAAGLGKKLTVTLK
jgi:ribosome-binding protein aMBF1 (putative translation factor)